ncbi:MAG: hypothetical protein QXW00_03215 [Candidatus Woesearchaeota archaeon]
MGMSTEDYSIKAQLEENSRKIQLLEEQNKILLSEIKKLREMLSEKKEPLKDEILRKLNRNRKNIIKGKILDFIGSSRVISIPEVKEAIVDQLRYCSKASFYRYLNELKSSGLVQISKVNDKEVVILSKQI